MCMDDGATQEAMRSRQIAERLGVEEAHMLEFQQFNMVWDKRMADYEYHAEDMVFAMRVRELIPRTNMAFRRWWDIQLYASSEPLFSDQELLDLP